MNRTAAPNTMTTMRRPRSINGPTNRRVVAADTEKTAMRIGGENRPSWIQRRHWERFGDSVAIKSSLVLKTLRDMSAALMPTAQTLSIDFTNSYGPCPIIEKILTVFRQRANAL